MRRRDALAALAALAALGPGCVLDFDKFGAAAVGPRDAGAPVDVPAIDVPTLDTPTIDATVDDVRRDAGPPVDRGPAACTPLTDVRLRLVHMATGFGPVKLCLRPATTGSVFTDPPAAEWPSAGVGYLEVSRYITTPVRVAAVNDPWVIAVVPGGESCASASQGVRPLASASVRLDPRAIASVAFTVEPSVLGGGVGTLRLLPDHACTDCMANTVSVRAVHAAVGSSNDGLAFSLRYEVPANFPFPESDTVFATNVRYPGTAANGNDGYDCDPAWYNATLLPVGYQVQVVARLLDGREVARSVRYTVKAETLQLHRMLSLFFAGDPAAAASPPTFVLCYDGDRGATAGPCDRIGVEDPSADAGAGDAGLDDASDADDASDDAAGDAGAWGDAGDVGAHADAGG